MIIKIIIETKKYFTLIFLVDMMQILLTMFFFGHDYDDIPANSIIIVNFINDNVVDVSVKMILSMKIMTDAD